MNERSADIIIIGGGIIGCALFHALAKATDKKILLIEQGAIASQVTGDSGGLIRLDYSDQYLLDLTTYSLAYYRNFRQHVGCEGSFVETGCFNVDDKGVSHYQSLAGYINPKLTCQQWTTAAIELQGRVLENTKVVSILHQANKILGVKTQNGDILANHVIVAAGVYSAQLLKTLPEIILAKALTNQAFQYSLYRYERTLSARIDVQRDVYIIPQHQHIIAGFLNRDQLVLDDKPIKPSTALTAQLEVILKELLVTLLPEKDIIDTKVSVDAFTEDHRGYTGAVLPYQGLFVAAGYSAGGIKLAPGIAQEFIHYF